MKLEHANTLLVSLLSIVSSAGYGDLFPPEGFRKLRSEESPQGSFEVVYLTREPVELSGDLQIWLRALKPGYRTQLLFSASDSAKCLMNPNESLIAIDHHVMDGLDVVDVMSRNRNGVYQEIDRNLLEAGFQAMVRQLKLQRMPRFDATHCVTDAWLRDGLLLCHLEAHESNVSNLNDWYFIYDVRHDRFLWDLSKINQCTFKLVSDRGADLSH